MNYTFTEFHKTFKPFTDRDTEVGAEVRLPLTGDEQSNPDEPPSSRLTPGNNRTRGRSGPGGTGWPREQGTRGTDSP